MRRATWCAIIAGMLLLAFGGDAARAQHWDRNSQELQEYVYERIVFIRMECIPTRRALDGALPNTRPVPRVRWATGAIISSEGVVVTAKHTLDDILAEKEVRVTGSPDLFVEYCEEDDVVVTFYRTTDEGFADAERDLLGATNLNGSLRDTESRYRSPVNDALFLQIYRGRRPVSYPFLCGRAGDLVLDDYEELEIRVGGVFVAGVNGNDEFGVPGAGRSLIWSWDDGQASKSRSSDGGYLEMEGLTAERGLSGAPVVDANGHFVGLVGGVYQSEFTTYSFFEPLYDFQADRVFTGHNQECRQDDRPPATPQEGVAQPPAAGEPRYLLQAVQAWTAGFGADGVRSEIFLPATTLLFDVDAEAPQRASSRFARYSRAVTQDGVEVFVYSAAIAPEPPLTCGEGEATARCIVFHDSVSLCLVERCTANEEDWLRLPAGEIAVVTGGEERGMVHLEIDRAGGKVPLYLPAIDLTFLEAQASVTRFGPAAELAQPHFAVEVQRSATIRTDCGQRWLEGIENERLMLAGFEIDILRAFELAEIPELDAAMAPDTSRMVPVTITNHFGGAGVLHEYAIYTFRNLRGGEDQVYLAEITYGCAEEETTIEEVFLRQLDGNSYSTTRLAPWSAVPPEIGQVINEPFLWAISNEEQYFHLMGILTDTFENRAVAGYFAAEFGKSCPRADRVAQCDGLYFTR